MKKNVITLLALFAFTIIKAQNVGIGTTTPNASARLDISATNKGLLIPRISLISTTDVTTITSPVLSLLVFNTNTAITGGSGAGFYAWSGTAWIKIALTTDITSGWGVSGNTLTNSDFIGSNNQQPIRFKLNGNNAGFIGKRKIYIGEGAGLSENSNYGGNNASIGIGSAALGSSTATDLNNIGIGDSALHVLHDDLSDANRNIALGHLAMSGKVSGNDNVGIGYASQKYTGSQYNTGGNISIGSYSMENVSSGGNNVAIGTSTLRGVFSAPPHPSLSQNVAIGLQAMRDATGGSNCIGIGFFSLKTNSGDDNIGIGLFSLYNNNNGFGNTSIGTKSMQQNINGNNNSALGDSALINNNNGDKNLALGFQAGQNNTNGSNNCFIGASAGAGNTTGDRNIIIGRQTYTQTPSSIGNIIIGSNAADTFDLGSNNTLIGAFTDVNANGYTQSTGLGYNAYVTASNQVKIGATTTTSIGGFQNWTNFSDGRFKQNVKPNVPGLDFILKLKPVTYNLDIEGIDKMLGKFANEEDDIKQNLANVQQAKSIIYTGFVAQEVQTAAQKLGFQFSGVDAPKNDKDFYGLRYAEFVVPLVKAVQEQQQKIEKVENENASLKNKLAEMMQRIEALEKSK